MVKKACNKYQVQKEENPEEVQEQEAPSTGPGFYRPISETGKSQFKFRTVFQKTKINK